MKKILLVDDEPSVRALLMATFRNEPRYQLMEASNGVEALAAVRRERPDLILLDIVMPQMDGFEVCRRLKSDPATRDITIIMLTALAQQADKERCLREGADGYFTKPFSPIALLQQVEETLNG